MYVWHQHKLNLPPKFATRTLHGSSVVLVVAAAPAAAVGMYVAFRTSTEPVASDDDMFFSSHCLLVRAHCLKITRTTIATRTVHGRPVIRFSDRLFQKFGIMICNSLYILNLILLYNCTGLLARKVVFLWKIQFFHNFVEQFFNFLSLPSRWARIWTFSYNKAISFSQW